MKRRFFSLFTALALCLTLLPTAALADGSHTHCVCGKTASCGDSHASATVWTGTATLPDSAGYYYLTADVELTDTWTPADGTVLCLNGHVIRYTGTDKDSVIRVEKGNFTLTDCNTTTEHYFTVNDSGLWVYAGDTAPAGVAYETVTGGVITGGTGYPTDKAGKETYGGGVYVCTDGSAYAGFTMNGGSIVGCTAKKGGGVCVTTLTSKYSTFFNMNGGRIIGCTAGQGGGVFVDAFYRTPSYYYAIFNMKDGRIESCTAEQGGGVYVSCPINSGTDERFPAKFTMTDSSIVGCTAKKGGGVYNIGAFTMTNSSITNCTATDSRDFNEGGGGGVLNEYSFTITNSSITGNASAFNGGGVYNQGTLNVSGTVDITGNQVPRNGAANNVFLHTDSGDNTTATITVSDGGLATASRIGVSTEAGGANVPLIQGTTVPDGVFTSDRETYYPFTHSGSAITTSHTHNYDQENTAERYMGYSNACVKRYVKSCKCGAYSETETFEVADPGHQLTPYVPRLPAKIDAEGREFADCLRCSYYNDRAIPKLPADARLISVTVKNFEADPVDKAGVTLTQGDRMIGIGTLNSAGKLHAETESNGTYNSFGIYRIAPDTYNLVINKDEKTVTTAITVRNEAKEDASDFAKISTGIFPAAPDDKGGNVTLPQYNTSSILTVKTPASGKPLAVVVDGLDRLSNDLTSGIYTDGEKDAITAQGTPGSSAIQMTVEEVTGNKIPSQITNQVKRDGSTLGLVLNLSLTKTVTMSGGSGDAAPDGTKTSVPVTDTGANHLLNIFVKLPAALQGKSSYRVYRLHNGQVDALNTTPNSSGESITVGDGGAYIIIHAGKFSEYAIGYDIPAPPPANPGGDGYSYHTIRTSADANGSIAPSGIVSVRHGSDKTFTITPNKGYVVSNVLVDGKSVGAVKSYTFEDIKTSHTIRAVFAPDDGTTLPILPIGLNHTDHTAYIQGFADGLFRPNAPITRAQTAVMLFRLLTPERLAEIRTTAHDFTDVPQDAWYREAVATMANGGYISGFADGTFGGNEPITRAQFVTILTRFIGQLDAECDFTDVPATHWAYRAIATATTAGWIAGFADGAFRPDQTVTRAQVVTILNRALARGVDGNSSLLDFTSFPDNPAGVWHYYDVIEAANGHDYTGQRPSETWTALH